MRLGTASHSTIRQRNWPRAFLPPADLSLSTSIAKVHQTTFSFSPRVSPARPSLHYFKREATRFPWTALFASFLKSPSGSSKQRTDS